MVDGFPFEGLPLIQSSVPVTSDGLRPDGAWWGENGRLYTPGDIVEGGAIVSTSPGSLIDHGTVWIDKRMVKQAERAGWRRNILVSGDLVQVER